MSKTLIRNIPINSRPRERLVKYGVRSLSDDELIAIILKTGTKDISAKDVSLNLLSKFKNISELKDIELNTILDVKGIGMVKSIELMAAIELGRRVYFNKDIDGIRIKNSNDVYEYFNDLLKDKKQEYFYVL